MNTLFLQSQPLPKNSLLTFLGCSHSAGEMKGVEFFYAEVSMHTLFALVGEGSPVRQWLSCPWLPQSLSMQGCCTPLAPPPQEWAYTVAAMRREMCPSGLWQSVPSLRPLGARDQAGDLAGRCPYGANWWQSGASGIQ